MAEIGRGCVDFVCRTCAYLREREGRKNLATEKENPRGPSSMAAPPNYLAKPPKPPDRKYGDRQRCLLFRRSGDRSQGVLSSRRLRLTKSAIVRCDYAVHSLSRTCSQPVWIKTG